MTKRRRLAGLVAATMVVTAMMGLPAIASAHEGEFAKFDNCPSTSPEVKKCIYSVTEGGEVMLGKKRVPIVNPAVLQAGIGPVDSKTFSAPLVEATNGVTLSKAPQPVPGGLAGLVNCKEISDPLLRGLCEAAFENGLTGVNSTLELARPVNEAEISELNLLFRKGVAFKLPVKFHLENPLLGSNCYVGSSSSPVIWNLTTGTTAPPPPNEPISGSVGQGETIEEGAIVKLNHTLLVDNAWAAPGATGCGGPLLEGVLDPIINASTGVPAAAGTNTAVLETTAYTTTSEIVNEH